MVFYQAGSTSKGGKIFAFSKYDDFVKVYHEDHEEHEEEKNIKSAIIYAEYAVFVPEAPACKYYF